VIAPVVAPDGVRPVEPALNDDTPAVTVVHDNVPEPFVASNWPFEPSVEGSVYVVDPEEAGTVKPTNPAVEPSSLNVLRRSKREPGPSVTFVPSNVKRALPANEPLLLYWICVVEPAGLLGAVTPSATFVPSQ
jgi:hypothetical protein